MSKKALVLGGNGFIGQNLIFWLLNHNFTVFAIDRNDEFSNSYLSQNFNLNYLKVDLSLQKEVKKIAFENFDVIYILAAMTGTKTGFDNYQDFLISNEMVLLNILDAYKERKSKGRLVFPSSRLVYKGLKDTFLKEDSEKEAKTLYAANKIAGELFLECWANAFNIAYTIFRICVPYGQLLPGDYSYGTLGFITNQAKQNGVITLYGNGKQKRTFTHVVDICEILGKVPFLENSLNLTLNIGSNDNIEIRTLAEMIAESYNAKVEYKEWPELDLKIETGDTLFDDGLLQSIFPYRYLKDLKKTLKR